MSSRAKWFWPGRHSAILARSGRSVPQLSIKSVPEQKPLIADRDIPEPLSKEKPMARVYNFSPGPAMLPAPVLERAQAELREWHSTGVSVMEMSHRGKDFIGIAEKAEADLRELLAVPE